MKYTSSNCYEILLLTCEAAASLPVRLPGLENQKKNPPFWEVGLAQNQEVGEYRICLIPLGRA
jgi:hypothetical protein